jgi:uncharacterized membrane protein
MLLNRYEDFLKKTVSIIEVFSYTISIIIIAISIVYSVLNYIKEYANPTKAYFDTRLILGESISLALSFILSVEILKLFYIKSYRQLVMLASLVLLKLIISYYLTVEIESTPKQFKPYQMN